MPPTGGEGQGQRRRPKKLVVLDTNLFHVNNKVAMKIFINLKHLVIKLSKLNKFE